MIFNDAQKMGHYYRWLISFVNNPKYVYIDNYGLLLRHLLNREFTWILEDDENRANDGMYLRYTFTSAFSYDSDESSEPCSILEMMIAIADRCESRIMRNSHYGDRTARWFWEMMCSLGLDIYTDDNFYVDEVDNILDIFLNRQYRRNGDGGLFTINNRAVDMRDVTIQAQLYKHLNENMDPHGVDIW